MNKTNTIFKILWAFGYARNSHRPEIKLSQSVMVGLLGPLCRTRGSIAQVCTFLGGSLPARTNVGFKNCYRLFSTFPAAVIGDSRFLTRYFSSSPRLNISNELIKSQIVQINPPKFHNVEGIYYKPIGAFVIKDRNPTGKFKISPEHKGTITIFIGVSGIIEQDNSSFSERVLLYITRQAFIFNLEDNKQYELKILARIGKHNINITHYYSSDFLLHKKRLKKNIKVFDNFLVTKEEIIPMENFRYFWENLLCLVVKSYINNSKLSLYLYKNEKKFADYITIIFKPLRKGENDDSSLCEKNLSTNPQDEKVGKVSNVNTSSINCEVNENKVVTNILDSSTSHVVEVLKIDPLISNQSSNNSDNKDINISTLNCESSEGVGVENKDIKIFENRLKGYIRVNYRTFQKRDFSSMRTLEPTISNTDSRDLTSDFANGGYKGVVGENKIKSESKIDEGFVTSNNREVKSKSGISKFIFNKLQYILQNEPINRDTQIKIEKFVYSQVQDYLVEKEESGHQSKNPKLGINNSYNFNSKFNEFCINKIKDFNIYLNKARANFQKDKSLNVTNINELVRESKVIDYYIKTILGVLPNKDITGLMLYIWCLIITFDNNRKFGDDSPITLVNNGVKLGKYITSKYLQHVYAEYLKNNLKISFTKFKEEFLLLDQNNILNSDELFLKLGSICIEIMDICSLLSIKVINESRNQSLVILKISDEVLAILDRKNPVLVTPINLPMIVKPKPYSKDELGGYLLNDVDYSQSLIVDKLSYRTGSKIDNSNIVYKSINNMSATAFKINNDLLDFLLGSEKYKHNLLLDVDYLSKLENIIKRTPSQEKEYQECLSNKILQEYVIEIAKVYSNVPEIYFPLKLDNRGRLYPIPIYLNYQGSELAKALILFARPDVIKRSDQIAIEYLKAYGATCYGNGLNRKSYVERLDWVNTNWEGILDFENSDLISIAENKFLFISFCFEMRRFNTFWNNLALVEFKTYLPIQLDGTCNGFQHLALLSNETKIFQSLNLTKADKSDRPIDFYEAVVDQINIYLKDKINCQNDSKEILESCERLIKLDLTRSTIKSAIMTIPYNATSSTLVEYIIKNFEYSHGESYTMLNKNGDIENKYLGWYKAKNLKGEIVLISYKDIDLLVRYINEIININYPKIKLLTEYLKKMCDILNNLNLPIVWRLPTGLVISQEYMKKYTKQIKPFKNLKTSISLTFTDKIKTDFKKQKLALMPNVVHSLDSSVLLLLYNSFYSHIGKGGVVNFYSVHDCYGVTAKYVEDLITILKTIYIELYSDSNYLQKFDKDLINMISSAYGDKYISYNEYDRIIYLENEKVILPNIKNLLEIKDKPLWYSSLSKSKYLIK